jgi:dihydroorotase
VLMPSSFVTIYIIFCYQSLRVTMESITIVRPDDWHVHLRDGEVLPHTVLATAKQMRRAVIMPNLSPPILYAQQALEYRARIMKHIPDDIFFNPLMVLYLTDQTTPDMIHAAALTKKIIAVKLYPAGATTNSSSGVTNIDALSPVIEALVENEMPLLIHGETTDQNIDVFDREKKFIDEILVQLVEKFPKLRIVLEHITTKEAVQFVSQASDQIAATITVQHLAYNRNHMLVGGIKPHYYCLPILKRSTHQKALQDIVSTGNKKFFLGTDSAPHSQSTKESSCGCAGCYSAYAAIELYAEIFEELGCLNKLEAFSSFYGPDFYQLPRNFDTITLEKTSWTAPNTLLFGKEKVVPLKAGEIIRWKIKSDIKKTLSI